MARNTKSDQPAFGFLDLLDGSSDASSASYGDRPNILPPAQKPAGKVIPAIRSGKSLLGAEEEKVTSHSRPVSPLPDIERVYRVGEFLDLINEVIKPIQVRIRGEISSVSERGNAFYLNLSDNTEQAVLNCVLWRNNGAFYREILKEGAEVEVTGSTNIYKPYGKFSLMIKNLTPVGEGALRQAFEALKRQLEEEGYFSPERKRSIPPFVHTIGLITSEFGDARKDFMTHLGANGLRVLFYDVRVEGVNAVDSIVEAIEWFNIHSPDTQVLVLTRGGGSLESLQAFNSLEVAQAIFSSRIPVISAVGHENDVSISDLVADLRASTPTHAGKILSEPWNRAREQIEFYETTMTRSFWMTAEKIRETLEHSYERTLSAFSNALQRHKNTLALYGTGMLGHFRGVFQSFERMERKLAKAEYAFSNRMQASTAIVEKQQQLLGSLALAFLERIGQKLQSAEQVLLMSDPKQKLKQGYSITYNRDGLVVKSVADLAPGDTLKTETASGSINSSVTEVHCNGKTEKL
ncbi:MAG: exodeoxyribonuclease VII large subunit [Patescibacteria group bacterium]|nr:exodeoxyribonuclease VII large subunit [Patescibacteria group bacterium]